MVKWPLDNWELEEQVPKMWGVKITCAILIHVFFLVFLMIGSVDTSIIKNFGQYLKPQIKGMKVKPRGVESTLDKFGLYKELKFYSFQSLR